MSATAKREAFAHSIPVSFSLNPPLFPILPESLAPISPVRTPSPASSRPPNIPMAGANPPMTKMEDIIATRYAPLMLPQPLNALLEDGYLK